MKYIIMCGGSYDIFKTPKQLTVINGEPLVARTIRLLKENGITDIFISSNDTQFKAFGEVLEHQNSYKVVDGIIYGYWLDAYYPMDEPCVYLHGDVYYSENAIKQIVNYKSDKNIFIGNEVAKNEEHKNWGEPFGWIVNNPEIFRKGIELIKYLQDIGRCDRGFAISWELYRVLNGLDINKQYILDDTYLSINDETIDIDAPWQIEQLENKVKDGEK